MLVPLLFLGLVIADQSPNADFRSHKSLAEAYQHTDERLIYFIDRPYSAHFYLHGKASKITEISAFQDNLTQSNHGFYVIRKYWLSSLLEAVKLRFE